MADAYKSYGSHHYEATWGMGAFPAPIGHHDYKPEAGERVFTCSITFGDEDGEASFEMTFTGADPADVLKSIRNFHVAIYTYYNENIETDEETKWRTCPLYAIAREGLDHFVRTAFGHEPHESVLYGKDIAQLDAEHPMPRPELPA